MAISKKLRRWLTGVIVAFASFVVSVFLSGTAPFQVLEFNTLDQLYELRGPLDVQESPIVLVAISQQADEELPEKFPWPTSYYARLIENLNRAGARVIGLDLIIDQKDIYDPKNDTLLAAALAKHKNVVMAGTITSQIGRSLGEEGKSASSQNIQILTPLKLLDDSNPNRWGTVGYNNDQDGSLRLYNLHSTFLDERYYAFGLEILRVYEGISEDSIRFEPEHLQFGPYRIPTGGGSQMNINFHGPPKTYPEYSFETIIDDKDFLTVNEDPDFQMNTFDDPEFGLLYTDTFRDKIVLVGATMLELHDFFSTPFAPTRNMPGYETHANAIQTVLSGDYVYQISPIQNLLIVFGLAVFIALVTTSTTAGWSFLTMITTFIGYFGLAIYSFVENSVWLYVTGPSLVIFFSYLSIVVVDYLTEQKEKRRIKGMFSSYVSPDLVNKMIESGEEPKLGGDDVYMTAFFSDIQSFSTFSEKLTPKQLVDLINEYLTAMTDILQEEGGTLDKYIGDAIVAFFGAPLPLKDHALRSCVASQRMHLKQIELREKWASEGDKWPDIVSQMQTRMGMNTGDMVTGNMGSANRFNYTMMGDNVNLAARCESGAKAYGVYTMVAEETKNEAERMGNDCVFRYLDKIVVKGRTKPVAMYEIVCLRKLLTVETEKCIKLYEQGIEQYLSKNWDSAKALFEQSAELEPNQPGKTVGVKSNPSLVMIQRCGEMKANPPEGEWDGVYIMTSK